MKLDPGDFRPLGEGLTRPEGVAVAPDGAVWVSDKGGAVARVLPEPTHRIGDAGGEPNGIAFLPDGRLLIANFQDCLQEVDLRTGEVTTFVEEVDGRRLLHTNHVVADAAGYVWATESTTHPEPSPETVAQMLEQPDGWIFVRRPDGSSERVADGLVFANGLWLSPDGAWLYVAETLSSTIRRARIRPGGTLDELELFCTFPTDGREEESYGPPGPDGMAFDAEGRLWVAIYNRNALAAVDPDGTVQPVVDDPSAQVLCWPTNLVFAGPDRRQLVVGSIFLPFVSTATAPDAGAPQPWEITTPASD